MSLSLSTKMLKKRANDLGRSIHEQDPIRIEKSLRVGQCDAENLSLYFTRNLPPVINENQSLDSVVTEFNRVVTDALKKNKKEAVVEHTS